MAREASIIGVMLPGAKDVGIFIVRIIIIHQGVKLVHKSCDFIKSNEKRVFGPGRGGGEGGTSISDQLGTCLPLESPF